jgi:hypothetical protein
MREADLLVLPSVDTQAQASYLESGTGLACARVGRGSARTGDRAAPWYRSATPHSLGYLVRPAQHHTADRHAAREHRLAQENAP